MQIFNRYEFKYPIPQILERTITDLVNHQGMEPDPRSIGLENNTYPVTSLYFDSPRMEDYADKAGGFLSRKKIRVRIYAQKLTPSTSELWLERKDKYDMKISKRRIALDHDLYDNLIGGKEKSLYSRIKEKEVHAAAIFYPIFSENMKPAIIVRYERAPLISRRFSDLRITFDSNIEACQSNDLGYTRFMVPVAQGKTIMEVKFTHLLPYWFHSLIEQFGLVRQTFSKYANGVEAVYKYHPIPR